MDNRQFIKELADRLKADTAQAEKLMAGFCGIVGEQTRDLNRVALPSLGSFRGVKRDETVVRDLSTGRRLLLPPAIELEFIAGGRLRNGISEGPAR